MMEEIEIILKKESKTYKDGVWKNKKKKKIF